MVMAQTVALLVTDVGSIMMASILPGSKMAGQRFWFAKAPSGDFVLETALGQRDIMQLFIEVLILGIGVAAYMAAQLICKMRRLRHSMSQSTSKGTPVIGSGLFTTNDVSEATRSTGGHGDPRLGPHGVKEILHGESVKGRSKFRSLSVIEGVHQEALQLFLLVLLVVGKALEAHGLSLL